MGNSQGKPVEFDGEGTDRNPFRPPIPTLDVSFVASVWVPLHNQSLTRFYCEPVNLNHFRLLRVVGRGAFGKVRIVERKDTGLSFALKYIRKDEGAQNH